MSIIFATNFFSIFTGFIFDCVFFMFYNVGSIFVTTFFSAYFIIRWFDLNSNSKSFFEILSIKDFLDDFLMYLFISLIGLKMLKSFSSGLILINTQLSSLSNFFVFQFHYYYFYQYVLIHQLQLQVYIYKDKKIKINSVA